MSKRLRNKFEKWETESLREKLRDFQAKQNECEFENKPVPLYTIKVLRAIRNELRVRGLL